MLILYSQLLYLELYLLDGLKAIVLYDTRGCNFISPLLEQLMFIDIL